jgi:hypothetical protein
MTVCSPTSVLTKPPIFPYSHTPVGKHRLQLALVSLAGWSPHHGPLLVQQMINEGAVDFAQVCVLGEK